MLFVPSVARPTPYLLASVTSLNQVRRFTMSGVLSGSFAAAATPRKMVLGLDGLLYVAKQDGAVVDRYNPTSGLLIGAFTSGGALNAPIGLAFSPDGELLVGSQAPNRIVQFHGPTGSFAGDFGAEPALGGPVDVTIGPDGDVYAVSAGAMSSVFRFSHTTHASRGQFTSGGSLQHAFALAFGPDGNLYVSVANDSKVSRFNGATGVFIDDFIPSNYGGLTSAADLVFGPDGNVYVASFQGEKILKYDGHTGSFLGEFALTGGQVAGLLFVDSTDTCGNSIVGTGEQCDLGPTNGTSGACCTTSCTFTLPGTSCRATTGACDVAETCSGFSAICPADGFADGTPCNDGDPCTVGDACGNNACAGQVPAPGSVCRAARRATLALSRPTNAKKRSLAWHWTADAAVDQVDFGDPTTSTPVGFCLLSGTQPVARFRLPAGAGWKAGKKNIVYRDPTRAIGGISQITLTPGAAGKAKIAVAASGAGLDITLPLALPVTARLQRGDSAACWESQLTVSKNDARRFKAR